MAEVRGSRVLAKAVDWYSRLPPSTGSKMEKPLYAHKHTSTNAQGQETIVRLTCPLDICLGHWYQNRCFGVRAGKVRPGGRNKSTGTVIDRPAPVDLIISSAALPGDLTMPMTPRMLTKWERIRAKGRTRFILLRVLFPLVGVLLFFLVLLVVFLPDVPGVPLKLYLVAGVAGGMLVYVLLGILSARAEWETNERLFLETNQEKPSPASPPVPPA